MDQDDDDEVETEQSATNLFEIYNTWDNAVEHLSECPQVDYSILPKLSAVIGGNANSKDIEVWILNVIHKALRRDLVLSPMLIHSKDIEFANLWVKLLAQVLSKMFDIGMLDKANSNDPVQWDNAIPYSSATLGLVCALSVSKRTTEHSTFKDLPTYTNLPCSLIATTNDKDLDFDTEKISVLIIDIDSVAKADLKQSKDAMRTLITSDDDIWFIAASVYAYYEALVNSGDGIPKFLTK